MKKLLTLSISAMMFATTLANRTDSVFVASLRAGNALRMAYSIDKVHWTPVGRDYNLLQSDFGQWGSEKKMASLPSVLHDNDGQWYAIWALNNKTNQFATSHTQDLSCWVPQDYPYLSTTDENVISPILYKVNNEFVVEYMTSKGNAYRVKSRDFIHWGKSERIELSQYEVLYASKKVSTPFGESCSMTKVAWEEIDRLLTKAKASAYNAEHDNRGMGDDSKAFAKVKDVKVTLSADLAKGKPISENLIGIFFEDINYAADGGLYAELLQNRDFEYSQKDRKEWNSKTAWDIQHMSSKTNEVGTNWTINTDSPLHANNSNYSTLDTRVIGSALINKGFDGICVRKGEKYDFSIFMRTTERSVQKVRISLRNGDEMLASAILSVSRSTGKGTGKGTWKQQKAVLTSNKDCDNAVLAIEPLNIGTIDIDFVSLFPQNTFKGRKNGLRADIAQTLADMKPRFVRFPGGCASHGNGIDNIYHWQATVGPLWERQHDWNIWHYHQSRGLGFHEYFQFCEDIGAEPLPVLSAGVPCQNSSVGGYGQQGGIPWERDLAALAQQQGKSIDEIAPYKYNGKALTMESYLQELLDLIEWANGDAKVSSLAKIRANAGHKAPFNLKYLGIGNEDLISEVFKERYLWLIKEVKKAHPEIVVVGTVGPFWEGSDYGYGWDIARNEDIEIVDEHYYNPVGWYLNHQDFYDKYSRNGTKVYLGEWASKGNRWENALAEAIHITNLERNADVVTMSSYAPLLAREGNTQWNPDLIYFNNKEVKPTPNYYIQMLAGQNSGKEYIFSNLNVNDPLVSDRIKASIVKADNGDVIVKIVNAQPKDANVNIDIQGLDSMISLVETKNLNNKRKVTKGTSTKDRCTLTQVSGAYDARSINKKESVLDIKDLESLTVPGYSFSVIRIHK